MFKYLTHSCTNQATSFICCFAKSGCLQFLSAVVVSLSPLQRTLPLQTTVKNCAIRQGNKICDTSSNLSKHNFGQNSRLDLTLGLVLSQFFTLAITSQTNLPVRLKLIEAQGSGSTHLKMSVMGPQFSEVKFSLRIGSRARSNCVRQVSAKI